MTVTMCKTSEMQGQRFGRLLVLNLAYTQPRGRGRERYWECRCDCGRVVVKAGIYLRTGDTKSCGCLVGDRCAERNITHGMAHTHRLYSTWKMMRARCHSKKTPLFKDYGGRGISICDRWSDFSAFVEDVWPSFKEGLTLNRKDNDGNYCPENCEWATDEEQANNTRRNHFLTAGGKTQTIARWAREVGISPQVIHKRIARGWNDTMAVAPIGL